MSIEIIEFGYQDATNEEYQALNDCSNQILKEQLPNDPPITLGETSQGLRNLPTFVKTSFWIARDEGGEKVIAFALVQMPLDDNLHLGMFDINVLPEFRRQGIGKKLLLKIVHVAQKEKRSLLITNTTDRIPAGEAFVRQIGAEKGMESHTNQLIISALDRELLHQWKEKATERGAGFELGVWEGVYPESDIGAIVELHDLLNQQPFGDLEMEAFTYSEEYIRQSEKSLFSRGYERWTIYLKEIETGKFAGYTEAIWNPNRPEIIRQRMTGVFPEHRNKGLGRWLKAEMLEMILEKRPQAKYVRTGNADMNAPMLKINHELGFSPYIANSSWQVKTDQVVAYLSKMNAG